MALDGNEENEINSAFFFFFFCLIPTHVDSLVLAPKSAVSLKISSDLPAHSAINRSESDNKTRKAIQCH